MYLYLHFPCISLTINKREQIISSLVMASKDAFSLQIFLKNESDVPKQNDNLGRKASLHATLYLLMACQRKVAPMKKVASHSQPAGELSFISLLWKWRRWKRCDWWSLAAPIATDLACHQRLGTRIDAKHKKKQKCKGCWQGAFKPRRTHWRHA